MITTRILISNKDTDIENFEDFNALGLSLSSSPRNSFIEDLKFSIKQGWIKNLHSQDWDNENKSAIYEYYSDDLHQTRYFQNYISSTAHFSVGVEAFRSQGWNVKVETVPENLVVPFVDAQRIFDQDIEVLV
jgi:hypothetical protein